MRFKSIYVQIAIHAVKANALPFQRRYIAGARVSRVYHFSLPYSLPLLSVHGRTKGGNTGLRVSASFAEFSAANVPASSSSMSATPSRRTPKGARMGDGRKEGQGRRSRYAARHALRPKRKRDSSPSCGWVRNDGRGRRAGFGMTVVGGGLRGREVSCGQRLAKGGTPSKEAVKKPRRSEPGMRKGPRPS
jgi:hypothetical protein